MWSSGLLGCPSSGQKEIRLDSQIVEVLGRQLLVEQLLRAGIEVAEPVRDRGIDLIAYIDRGNDLAAFEARPIQMKAASARAWGIDRKYAHFPGLLLAYVWNVADSANAVVYAMTHDEAVAIAEEMGYAKSPSWRDHGAYSTRNPGVKLLELLERHRMTPERWQARLSGSLPAAR